MDPGLYAILARALAPDPGARWTAAQMRSQLDAFASRHDGRRATVRPLAPPARKARLIDECRELLRTNTFLSVCLLVAIVLFVVAVVVSVP
jgi:hypothetical protein